MRTFVSWCGVVVCVAGTVPTAPGAEIEPTVGAEAPPLEPSAWLNAPGAIQWTDLKGKLVLIERWATY